MQLPIINTILPVLLASLLAVNLAATTTGPENGALYIHGGGAFNAGEFVQLVKKATGKAQPTICVITTPQGERRKKGYKAGQPFRLVTTLKERFQLKNVTELYTLSKKEANSPEFYSLIDNADGIHMSGGNQCFLTNTFLETESLAAMKRLLERGGVISGSSAGAQVQSSFMTRGDYTRRLILGDKRHQKGFGFVSNSAFDVHVEERDREQDLFQVFRAKPSQLQDRYLDTKKLLGIGIDQNTAIIVVKNQFRVSGRGNVYLFDPHKWEESSGKISYQILHNGAIFDMVERRVLKE